jgi:ABC-type antimicrobial peptide transport system permease subunit
VWREVVGVVSSVRHDALDEPARATVYFPLAQRPTATVFAVLDGGAGAADRLAASLREGVRSIDPELPVYDVQTLETRLDDSLGRRRVAMWLVVAFAVVATALSIVGLYGVMAYDVGQRRREIAVRMALGADRGRVLEWVLWRGARPTIAGLLAGMAAALALTRVGGGLLYGVAPDDPITYAGTALVVLATAAAAAYLPARRAARVDPIAELR